MPSKKRSDLPTKTLYTFIVSSCTLYVPPISFSSAVIILILLYGHLFCSPTLGNFLNLSCICCTVCALLFFNLDAGLLARSQYSEGPATGHLDTGLSWFPCVYKQMLGWLPRYQFASICFSCSPPDLNLLATNFIFFICVK